MTVVKTLTRKILTELVFTLEGENRYLSGELKEFSDSIYSDKNIEVSDQKNMRGDIGHLMKTFKRVYSAK